MSHKRGAGGYSCLQTNLLLAVIALGVLAAAVAFGQAARSQQAAGWFSKPYELPKDVFDLPEFDRFRTGGKLNVEQARSFLESLSDSNLPAAQRLFDILAWKAFVALNWPARGDGQPDTAKSFGEIPLSTRLVWEFWEPTANVFLANGQKPAWNGSPSYSADHFKAGWRQTPTVNEGKQAFSGPLVDQNGHWVHYVSLMDRTEFDYVVENELYNLEGQAQYVSRNKIAFPVDTDTTHGSIEIKLAWKLLTDAEIASGRFLTRSLRVVPYSPAPPAMTADAVAPAHKSGKTSDNMANPSAQPGTVQTVGLIGMHISMRTRSSPQWIWATFEQIDNTRLDPYSADAKHPLPAHPSLSNPNDPEVLVGANLLPGFNATGPGGQPLQDRTKANPSLRWRCCGWCLRRRGRRM